MQLELLMDGLAQREAVLKLQASQQVAESAQLPTEEEPADEGLDQGRNEEGKTVDKSASEAAAAGRQLTKAHELPAAPPEAAHATAQQQQQQQTHEALARMTAENMPQLQALILQVLENTCKGLDPKNLLAPLQLNQLMLRRAEANAEALAPAVRNLLHWKSAFAQLR